MSYARIKLSYPPRKNPPTCKKGICPFGHQWQYVSGRLGYCDHDDCQVGWVSTSNGQKFFFTILELVDYLDKGLEEDEILKREREAEV